MDGNDWWLRSKYLAFRFNESASALTADIRKRLSHEIFDKDILKMIKYLKISVFLNTT